MAARSASGKKLVIVESPTKAKTIRKFLGKNFMVESCVGHIRDLPRSAKDIPEKFKKEKWATLGVNTEKDFAPLYCIPKDKIKIVSDLRKKVDEADELYLATDEDREGESISWHLMEVLKPKITVKRMVFNEITKSAIEDALKDTRNIDENLVKAQEARRILDRLVGYTISPLLWSKIAFGLSAGRVQSVAVRLICERELDRMRFKKANYWGLEANHEKDGIAFHSRLVNFEGKRVAEGKDFDPLTGDIIKDRKSDVVWLDEKKARGISDALKNGALTVTDIEEKPVNRKPAAPFITSTLQQESNRKFGWGARQTMQVAQKLYEEGFITYMRTDSTFLSSQAIKAARANIHELYGKEYLPDSPRLYEGKKVKGAQEAHEAVRPAGTEFQHPETTGLGGDQLKLYDLIWKRTMASQMTDARQKRVSVKMQSGASLFAANGNTIEFAGFLRAYVEGSDDPEAALEERDVRLPQLKEKESVKIKNVEAQPHETLPVARFTEASLIQTMEKEGIGRPSTYAPTIANVIDRGYVQKFGNALAPTITGMVVNKLLSEHFPQYVDLGFTSEMERSLDDIAAGDLEMVQYLKKLYFGKEGLKAQVESQGKKIDPDAARAIVFDNLKGFSVRVGKFGAYACRVDKSTGEEVCASIPDQQPPAELTAEVVNKLIDQKINGADALGIDEVSGMKVYCLSGKYGPYVQLGEAAGDKAKPKRMSVPPSIKPEDVTMEKAMSLLSLPKTVGMHPTSGKEVKVGLGRFGPYVVHDGDFRSIPKTDNLFEVSFARAMELLNQPKKGRGRVAALKEFGEHPISKDMIQVFDGRYGPYIKCGKINVSLPEGQTPETITKEAALQLLESKIDSAPAPKKAKKSTKGTVKAKAPVKKEAPKASAAAAKSKPKTIIKRSAAR